MTSGDPRSAHIATLTDRYDAAQNAQDLDAVASMHHDAIVFHNHTAGERVAGASSGTRPHRRDLRALADTAASAQPANDRPGGDSPARSRCPVLLGWVISRV
jgi:ketosteroid isomerase-like protein